MIRPSHLPRLLVTVLHSGRSELTVMTDLFAHYNASVWPAQYVLLVLGIVVAVFLLTTTRSSTVTLPILSFLWLWMGLVYFAGFFIITSPVAHLFAIAFVIEALLLIWSSVMSISPAAPLPSQRTIAAILFTYALVIYPLLGFAAGQRYPASITFGLPCPTVIFTFGAFCLLGRAISPVVYVIPVAWAVIGSVAAAQLGITQDFALPVAAAAALLLALSSRAVTRLKEAV